MNEEIFFDVTFTNGTNVQTEWFLDSNDTYLLTHCDQVRDLQLNFTFTVPGTHNVTAVAANTVTRTFDSMIVYAYYRLNWFNFTTSSEPLETSNTAVFNLTLSPSADLPMGTIKANLSYGDDVEETIDLNNYIATMQVSGHTISHTYTTQGNYTVSCVLYTEIDNLTLMATSYVWDSISVQLTALLTTVKVLEPIVPTFTNPPASGFRYLLDFGDGNTLTNNDTALYSAYVAELLSYAYSNDGIYNMTLSAWNPFYSSYSSLLITVQYPIPEENITISPTEGYVAIPDGIFTLTLSLTEDNPSPTDVNCTYDFGAMTEAAISTVFAYGQDVVKSYTYNTSGPFTISVTCLNLVSTMTKTSTVTVLYKLSGLNITTSEDTVASTASVLFSIQLSPTANTDVGTMNVNMTYGDGNEETLSLNSYIHSMQSGGHDITHSYTVQGNYSVTAIVYTEVDNMTFTLNVLVWDRINVTLDSLTIAKVGDSITFSIINPPPTGFLYTLDYGDGNSDSNTDPSVVNKTYSAPSLSHSYTTDGVFNITFVAWNGFYSQVISFNIIVQHPIPDNSVTLTATDSIVPVPDGEVELQMLLTTTVPQPTNVTCDFDYQDSAVYNVSTSLESNVAVVKNYTYLSGGNRTITFSCRNLVSSVTLSLEIAVQNFTLQDFEITYPSPVPMNSTLKQGVPHGEYPNLPSIYEVSDDPATVTFSIGLLGCTKMPPDIQFTWDFGDDTSPETVELTSQEMTHTYTERNNYTVSLTIADTTSTHDKTFNVTMGVLNISVNPLEGVIGETEFEFTITGATVYTFDASSNFKIPGTINRSFYKYSKWGVYYESVIAQHGNEMELVYLQDPIEVDYNITDALEVTLSNTTVPLPPGTMNITVSIIGSTTTPQVNCSINLNDPINKDTVYQFQNLTLADGIFYTATYGSLGKRTLEVNCTNYVSSHNTTMEIEVVNSCFSDDGIFDRKFSDHTTPMMAFTSMTTALSNRMPVNCETVSFDWEVYRVEIVNDVPVLGEMIINRTDAGGTTKFTRGEIKEGLVSVSLRITSDDTWIEESMYINFIKLPPIAFITGGGKISARYMDNYTLVDARTDSYDPELGYGGNQGLDFEATCYM